MGILRISTILFLIFLYTSLIFAGNTGTIKGKVLDKNTGEPLIGANINIINTLFGASTYIKGEYSITSVPPGSYKIKSGYVGYQSAIKSDVVVDSDKTTVMDFHLSAAAIIECPVIQPSNPFDSDFKRNTFMGNTDILPVRGIPEIIALNPGFNFQDNTLFIRGGKPDETGYYINDVNTTNPVTGKNMVSLNQNAVDWLQVKSGCYNAEYGNANSGIILQHIKSGIGPRFSIEFITDNAGFQLNKNKAYSGDKRLGAYWYGYNEATGTINIPLINKTITLFGLINYFYQRDIAPQAYPGINIGTIRNPNGSDSIDLHYPAGLLYKNSLESYNATGNLSFNFDRLAVRFTGSYYTGTSYNPFSAPYVTSLSNILNLDRTEQVINTNGLLNLAATHNISTNLFVEINFGYSFNNLNRYDPYLKDNFMAYGDSVANARAGFIFPSRFSFPITKDIMGFAFQSYGTPVASYQKNKTSEIYLKGLFTSKLGKNPSHTLTIGGEMQRFTLRNFSLDNSSLFFLSSMIAYNDPSTRTLQDLLRNMGVNNYGYDELGNETSGDALYAPYHPLFGAFFIQDKFDSHDLNITAGLRYDYIDPDIKNFIDPSRPEKSFQIYTGELIPEGFVKNPPLDYLSPRLSISFPFFKESIIHAQFGRFVQMPRSEYIYQGLNSVVFNLTRNLLNNIPIGFNVHPSVTIQYEVGFYHPVSDFGYFNIIGFYKENQKLLRYGLHNTASASPFGSYIVLANDAENISKGIEISFNMRRTKRILAEASLTFQSLSNPGESSNMQGTPLSQPFYGDIILDYRFEKNDGPSFLFQAGISALIKFASGRTFSTGTGFSIIENEPGSGNLIEYTVKSPATFQVDLRIDKGFTILNTLNLDLYIYVINLFDTQNILTVFKRTGSASDDGYLSDPSLGGNLINKYGPKFAELYKSINLDYHQAFLSSEAFHNTYPTSPLFYGPPRQIRLGVKLEY